MTEIHKPCPACTEARTACRFTEASACRGCGGTGILRTRESYACNRCGDCLCPDAGDFPHGLVETRISGGYNSTHLTDCTTYLFSLCEKCLREIFDSCKIKPSLREYAPGVLGGDDLDPDESYEEEAFRRIEYDKKNQASKDEFARLWIDGLCADHERGEDGNDKSEYCAKPGVARLLHDDESWRYAKRWLCTEHLRDAYVIKDTTIHAIGCRPLPWAERVRVGLSFLTAFHGSRREVSEWLALRPDDAESMTIAVSTLFPLLMSPPDTAMAASVLSLLLPDIPKRATRWVADLVPLVFQPGDGELARLTNDWLTWGKEQRYDNAVATAFLGYRAETLWDKDAAQRAEPEGGT